MPFYYCERELREGEIINVFIVVNETMIRQLLLHAVTIKRSVSQIFAEDFF